MDKLATRYGKISSKHQNMVRGCLVALFFGVIGVIVLLSTFADSATVSGVVFYDYNGNGKRDNVQTINNSIATDLGAKDITVKGFDSDGQLCGAQKTNSNGEYALNMGTCTSTQFRIEFSDIPASTYPSQLGEDNQSTTQFVASGGVANLGINRPDEFCQNNPNLVTSCYSFGNIADSNTNNDTLVGFPFNISGTTTPPMQLGKVGQVGSTWGLAYRKSTQTLYSGAFMKRHADFGPGGSGAIYASPVPDSGTGSTAPIHVATIPDTGTDPHPISNTNCDSRDGQQSQNTNLCWARDEFSFSTINKRGLGGLALFSDPDNTSNDSLLTINLNNRKIYKVSNLDTTKSVSEYNLPLNLPNSGADALPEGSASGQHQPCTLYDVRPFAVTVYEGTGYVGITCSAQTSRNQSDLRAYVYSFIPQTMTFSTAPTLEFPLNYGRSCSNGNNNTGCWQRANWLPWIDSFDDPLVNDGQPPMGNGVKILTAPQPILTDITFGSNGSMTIGLRDRYGDQMGYQAFNTNNTDNTLYIATSTGDLLRACSVNGKFTLENAGLCDGKGPGSSGVHAVVDSLPQGPGDFEFYNFDFYADDNDNPLFHDEGAQGGLAQVPGFSSIVSSAMNPLRGIPDGIWSGGLRWYNSDNGTKNNAYRLYQSDYQNAVAGTPYFGKANGIGDIEAICKMAPIEVGNLVWNDKNSNGIQDAGEPVIPGVTVSLLDNANNVLATAITDSNGNYIFSNRVQDEDGNTMNSSSSHIYGVSGLTTNTQGFRLELRNESDYMTQDRLNGLYLTTADSRINDGNSQNDSNAVTLSLQTPLSASNPAVVTFDTGPSGANNHTLDFGFTTASIVNPPVQDSETTNPTTTTPNSTENTTSSPVPQSSTNQVKNKPATIFANTGQVLIASMLTAIVLISCGVGVFVWVRRGNNK